MTSTTAPSPLSWAQRCDRFPNMLMKKLVNDPQKRALACKVLTVAMLLGLLLLIAYTAKRVHRRIVGHRQSVDDATADKTRSRAKFLVRESARLVASALEKRGTNLLDAYEDAAQAAVLARTAKEIDDDVSKLTQDLGVDFYEYLTYTASVLQEIRSKLRGP
jgi:hypothetical protein